MTDCCLIGCVKDIGTYMLTECLWPPVKSHIDYWWCFDINIQNLRDEVRDLDRETLDMKQKIEDARLRAETLRTGVEDWLNSATEKLAEVRRIWQHDNIPKAWDLISRYSVGKSAKKTAEEIANLRNNGNFSKISDPAPPAAMGSTSHRPTMNFQSRKNIEEDIIQSLRNNSVSMIGICGMGGVGKTTMVERITKRVKEENLFDEVVMVVVSQQVDLLKIQKEIAELLGLEFDVESMSARANKLRTRLMDTKRKIIIFDDVWESIKLKDLGVPFESGFEGCKILLTSRSKYICYKMEAQKVIAMGVLTKEEAWILFKEKAGDWVEKSVLRPVAEDVAAECKGLPIALVTVGMALQHERGKRIWEDSLSQLRESNPTDFPEVLADVYNPLKLSYDYLKNESEGLLFLLCCLFPEDYNIPVEHLTWYSMGLSLFDGIRNIEAARNRTHRFVKNLKSRFLLMDGRNENHVKMHDVVRDVAIFIGSKEKHGFLKSLGVTSMDLVRENSSDNCNWMSVSISNERIDLPLGLHFPNLRLLMMLKSNSDIKDMSFEGMEDLNVLSFLEIELPPLPRTLGLLQNLQTLHLYCSTVTNISVACELASLEILSCFSCKDITELPAEIGRLNRLRLLEMSYCSNLKTIAAGVISSLVRLEELKMRGSFCDWEAEEEGKERRNAALTELESLPNLTWLEIDISDCNLAAQEICLSQKLVKYCVRINCKYYYSGERDHEKVMNLNLPRHITVGKWIDILVRNTEYLVLEGDGSNDMNLAEIENLRNLNFSNCSTVKKVVNTIDCKFGTVFPLLESLNLFGLEKLEEICDGPISEGSSNLCKSPNQNVSLSNLTSIRIQNCYNLRYLFSVSMARNLLRLEDLDISRCVTMEQVFRNENKSITVASIEFPKLKSLKLTNLSNLTTFCQGVESIQFHNLKDLKIYSLSKFNSFIPLNSEPPHDDTSFHFLCNQKVEIDDLKKLRLDKMNDSISNIWCNHIPINVFRNLEKLTIYNCNGIRNLMSSSIAKNFVSLNYLCIEGCLKMVEVIEDEEEVVDLSLFPALKHLKIIGLLKLRSFCQWKHSFELPLLEEVAIQNCPVMETFTLGSLSAPNIKKFTINRIKIDDTKDLNGALHHFKTESWDDDDDEDGDDDDDDDDDDDGDGDGDGDGERKGKGKGKGKMMMRYSHSF